jgi:hypothetical protein
VLLLPLQLDSCTAYNAEACDARRLGELLLLVLGLAVDCQLLQGLACLQDRVLVRLKLLLVDCRDGR